MNKNLIPLGFIIAITGCGGDGDRQTLITPVDPQSGEPITGPATLVYSYPADGQRNVSPISDLILRFNTPVNISSVNSSVVLSGPEGQTEIKARAVDGGRSIVLDPIKNLELGTEYDVSFSSPLETADGRLISNPTSTANTQPGIQFTTRGGFSGVKALDTTSPAFEIANIIPRANTPFQPSDLSAFRLELTQPVDPQWKDLGGQIRLLDANGNVVPSEVLVKDRRITLDPCTTGNPSTCGSPEDKLLPGGNYTLSISNLPSTTGERLTAQELFSARASEPTAVQFQNATNPALLAGNATSKLNGQAINGVILNSVLQGVTDQSTSLGGLFTELAFAPSFGADEALPLRIPRGSRLTGSSLPVRVNGTVAIIDQQTGELQQTGDINVVMVSDATGYLLPNPYTQDQNAPRHVRLFMDVAMNTEAAQPNASLSQDLLHVELVGIALVEDGILTIDAIGIVEPNLLGQEVTNSTIAFQIQADTSVDTQLQALETRLFDNSGPRLVSWLPGDDETFPGNRDQMQRPGDPVILNFDEPLLPSTVEAGVVLLKNNGEVVETRIQADGTTVSVNPLGGLEHGVPYTVLVTSDLTDLAGNGSSSLALNFELPDLGGSDVPVVSPIPLTTYPGYPCVTTDVNFEQRTHGQCLDAAPDGPRGQVLPISPMPADRPIVVVFSQSMDPNTVRLGETFKVHKLSETGEPTEEVSGRLEFSNQRIRFFPDRPWEDSFYRYQLVSRDGPCEGEEAICSELGMPFKADLLVDPSSVGGPNLDIVFRGSEPTASVYTPLRNLPVRDTNSNYVVDCDTLAGTDCLEPFNHELVPGDSSEFAPSANSAKLLVRGSSASVLGAPVPANVGCTPGTTCPENKFIYQTFALNTDVVGPVTPEPATGPEVDVILYPTQLAATSASVFLAALGEQATGTTILRMKYQEPSEDNPFGFLKGQIFEDEKGETRFRTVAPLTLDAPNLSLPAAQLLNHDLYSKDIELHLEGPITFFDDGRMQVSLISQKAVDLDVNVNLRIPLLSDLPLLGDLVDVINGLGAGAGNIVSSLACFIDPNCDEPAVAEGPVIIPLQIPEGGVNLNFISFPIKQVPETHRLDP
ncbi:Ig-like domain-containing protein [Marinobacter sp. NSM]|uniref:Ig-like domain-containing protein n=1 Tax=Marinobacter sp. NSM TaxID=3458004 RepID=UPI0040367F7F